MNLKKLFQRLFRRVHYENLMEYDNAAYLRLVSSMQELWRVGGEHAKARCDSALLDSLEEGVENDRKARHNRHVMLEMA